MTRELGFFLYTMIRGGYEAFFIRRLRLTLFSELLLEFPRKKKFAIYGLDGETVAGVLAEPFPHRFCGERLFFCMLGDKRMPSRMLDHYKLVVFPMVGGMTTHHLGGFSLKQINNVYSVVCENGILQIST